VVFTEISQVTGISVQYMEAYKQAIDNVGDAVSTSVIDMNTLITKCQELNEDLKPVETLANQM
jgi:hypothetical protein